MSKNSDKGHRASASQFFVAGELCRRGHMAVVTMGNSPTTDILCSNKDGSKCVHIQVKTFVPGTRKCAVGLKAETNPGPNFFWVLAGIPEADSTKPFEYYIIPSKVMAPNIKKCFERWKTTPGKKGKRRNQDSAFRAVRLPPANNLNGWNVSEYKDAWKLIEDRLK
jgi:hypothetical protein